MTKYLWTTIWLLSIALAFLGGALVQSHIHSRSVPTPHRFAYEEVFIKIPKTPEEHRRLMLLNRAQWGMLEEIERLERKLQPKK